MNKLDQFLAVGRGWFLTVAGGLLWIAHSVMEGFEPIGTATEFRSDTAVLEITHTGAFVLYNLWGAVALMLLSVGLYSLSTMITMPSPQLDSGTRFLSLGGFALGLLMLSAVLIQSPTFALFTLIFASLAVGFGTTLAGVGSWQSGSSKLPSMLLIAIGILSIFSVSLRPIVDNLDWLPNAVTVAALSGIGIGWAVVGAYMREFSNARE